MAKRKRSLHVLPEPKWSKYQDPKTDAEKKEAFNSCLYFVHYEIQPKSGVAPLKQWMREHWDKSIVDKILKLPDSTFHGVAKYAYCWKKLGWMPDDVATYLTGCIDDWVQSSEAIVEEKADTPKVVSIRNNLNNFSEGVDISIDNIILGTKITAYKEFVESYSLNKAEIEMAVSTVDDLAMEFRVLAQGSDKELAAAYSHIKKATLKHLLAFFDGITIALTESVQAKKITRIRRKRPTDKKKLVSKLKYTVSHAALDLTSIDPVDIIGASEVWFYDIKRKRLGVYASEYKGTLGVKGTAIDNYSVGKSYEVTLRKPELVKEFMKCRKNGLHLFMKSIRASKRYEPKTRVQQTMVLLKVIK